MTVPLGTVFPLANTQSTTTVVVLTEYKLVNGHCAVDEAAYNGVVCTSKIAVNKAVPPEAFVLVRLKVAWPLVVVAAPTQIFTPVTIAPLLYTDPTGAPVRLE